MTLGLLTALGLVLAMPLGWHGGTVSTPRAIPPWQSSKRRRKRRNEDCGAIRMQSRRGRGESREGADPTPSRVGCTC